MVSDTSVVDVSNTVVLGGPVVVGVAVVCSLVDTVVTSSVVATSGIAKVTKYNQDFYHQSQLFLI